MDTSLQHELVAHIIGDVIASDNRCTIIEKLFPNEVLRIQLTEFIGEQIYILLQNNINENTKTFVRTEFRPEGDFTKFVINHLSIYNFFPQCLILHEIYKYVQNKWNDSQNNGITLNENNLLIAFGDDSYSYCRKISILYSNDSKFSHDEISAATRAIRTVMRWYHTKLNLDFLVANKSFTIGNCSHVFFANRTHQLHVGSHIKDDMFIFAALKIYFEISRWTMRNIILEMHHTVQYDQNGTYFASYRITS